MSNDLKIHRERVERGPLVGDLAIPNSPDGHAAEFDRRTRWRETIAECGMGTAEGPHDGDEVVLSDHEIDRHLEIRERLDLALSGGLVLLQREVPVQAMADEFGRIEFLGGSKAPLIEDLCEDARCKSFVSLERRRIRRGRGGARLKGNQCCGK